MVKEIHLRLSEQQQDMLLDFMEENNIPTLTKALTRLMNSGYKTFKNKTLAEVNFRLDHLCNRMDKVEEVLTKLYVTNSLIEQRLRE